MSSPFYVSIEKNTLHRSFCYWRPENYEIYLGFFNSPSEAMKEAIRKGYYNIEVCKFCCTVPNIK